jgi:tetratricopeptide (TPR) repeat protein
MRRFAPCSPALLALLLLLGAAGTLPAQQPPQDDLEIRDHDELIRKDNPSKIWRGTFRRDGEGRFEVTPNGKWLFEVREGDLKGITLKVAPDEVKECRLRQSEREVWEKQFARLPTGRLDVPKYMKHAEECVEKGYLDLAEDLLRRALEIDDQNVDLYLKLGSMFRRRFKFNEELKLYRKALDEGKFPQKEAILARFGDLYRVLGLHRESETSYLEALKILPGHVPSLAGLGKLYIELRRFEEAVARLEKAAQAAFGEDKATHTKSLGIARLKTGDLEGARKAFEDAAYQMLGYTYLIVAVVRAIAMFVDKSVDPSNLISLAVEIVFGIVLIL